jgi:hypothetical protein
MQVEELDSNDLVNMCIQGDKESLQEYTHRVVKLTARAPGVSESSTIDAIVGVSVFKPVDLHGRYPRQGRRWGSP